MEYTSVSGTTTTSDWITTTYNPTPTTTTASGGTITVNPYTLVSSPSYTCAPTPVSVTIVGEKEVEEKIKKARDSVDKHVDELEQDLEYLNEQRQELEQTVLDMGERIAAQDDLIDVLQTKLEHARCQIENLQKQEQKYMNNNILGRIYALEDKIYEMDKRDVGQD